MQAGKRFQEEDVRFFLELMVTLVMIMLIWGLLGGCSYARPKEHPTVSLATAQISGASGTPVRETQYVERKRRISHYKVMHGDTLYRIAQKTGSSMDAIVMANGMSDPSKLAVGQMLVIPK